MKYITIGVKADNIQQLEDVITEEKIALNIKVLEEKYRVQIDFDDLREEFRKMGEFLKENNLEDENPFFREFDINPYGLIMDFNFRGIETPEEMYPIISIIAQAISKLLTTSCIFMTNDMRDPIALYENGSIIKQWR